MGNPQLSSLSTWRFSISFFISVPEEVGICTVLGEKINEFLGEIFNLKGGRDFSDYGQKKNNGLNAGWKN